VPLLLLPLLPDVLDEPPLLLLSCLSLLFPFPPLLFPFPPSSFSRCR
jgi:hypothetical protein